MPAPTEAPALFTNLLAQPFPAEPDAPHPDYAFDAYCQFLANAPRRLIAIVDAGYYDPLQYSPGEEPDPIDLELRYERLFADAIAAVAIEWGPATFLGLSILQSRLLQSSMSNIIPGDPDADYALFDEDVFMFDVAHVAFWRQDNRLAFLHLATQYGDGDIQLSVCCCVVPAKK